MELRWKEESCKDCKFRVGDVCRRFPPMDEYPVVAWDDGSEDACAEYEK